MDTFSSVVLENPAPTESARGDKRKSPLIPVIAIVLGMLVMLYPVVSTVWNNYSASRASSEYAKLETTIPQEVHDAQWANAHEYNKHHTVGPILDPWINDVEEDNEPYAEYLRQLNATDVMARLVYPEINVDLPVYHGTSDEVLGKGVGHLFGSDLPVGDKGTHSVLTGHTGLPNMTLFDNLRNAEEGDVFYVQVSGHKLKYVVDQIKVVLPHETDDLKVVEGKDYITLITCTPYGINTHRLLVRGHQEPLEPAEEAVFDQAHGSGLQWWMYVLVAVVIAVGARLIWWMRKQSGKQTEAVAMPAGAAGAYRPKHSVNARPHAARSKGPKHSRKVSGGNQIEEHDTIWERDDD